MQTIFDPLTREELIKRINSLDEHHTAQWGKMIVYQAVQHCILWDTMILTNKKYPRAFIGLVLGKVMLRNEVKDDRPMRRNNPTISALKIKETRGDFSAAKRKWTSLIEDYAWYTHPDNSFIHPFFGPMTKEQIGYHAFKHSDHHLRQFKS